MKAKRATSAARLPVVPPSTPRRSAAVTRPKGFSGADAVERVSAKTNRPKPLALSHLDAFCIHPELTMAEWVRGLGMTFPPDKSIDDCMCDAQHVFIPVLSTNPRYMKFYDAVYQRPEELLQLPADAIDIQSLQYARIVAARAFTGLWVTADNLRTAATFFSKSDRELIESEHTKGALDGPTYRLCQDYIRVSDGLRDAFCRYGGVDDIWKVPSLTSRELLRLLARPHPPKSREGVLLEAMQEFARLEAKEELRFTLRSMPSVKWSLETVRRLASILAVLDALTPMVIGKKQDQAGR